MKKKFEEFINAALIEYPEYKDQIMDEDWDDLPYLQMGVFTRIVNDLILDGDESKFKQILTFLGEQYEEGDDKLKNIFAVSFLEHLKFKGKRFIALMPKVLLEVLVDITEYNKEILNDSEIKRIFKKMK